MDTNYEKKREKIFSIIVLITISIATIGYFIAKPRDPRKVLRNSLRNDFNIECKILKPVVTNFEEEWCPNGDGYCIIKFDYSASKAELEPYFQKMESLPAPKSTATYPFLYDCSGYYMRNEYEDGSFQVIVLDTLNKKGTFMINIM